MVPLASSSGSLISDFPMMKIIMLTLEKLPLQCSQRLKLPTCRLGSGGGFSAVHTLVSPNILNTTSDSGAQHKCFYSLASLVSTRPKGQSPSVETILISELYRSRAFMCRFANAFLVLYLGITAFPKSGLTVLSQFSPGDSRQEGPLRCSLSADWFLIRVTCDFFWEPAFPTSHPDSFICKNTLRYCATKGKSEENPSFSPWFSNLQNISPELHNLSYQWLPLFFPSTK